MPVLDATFLIDVEHRRTDAVRALRRLLSNDEALLVPAQTAAEFAAGREDEVAALADVEGSFAIVAFGPRHILEAARLARAAYRRGRFPGWPDIHVAAVAALEGTFVVTADAKNFRPMGCAVWDYRRDAEPPK